MKLKVWVEVFTVDRYTEDIVEVDDVLWNAMTPAEREAYKGEVFNNAQNGIANGGCEEVES